MQVLIIRTQRISKGRAALAAEPAVVAATAEQRRTASTCRPIESAVNRATGARIQNRPLSEDVPDLTV